MSHTFTTRIFVAIPCYRDSECRLTVHDLFAAAAVPGRITVGVCLQMIPGVDDALFRGMTKIPRVRAACFDARTVPGLGWARSQAHTLREDEPYTLQIDSHMRFHAGWDTALLEMLAACPAEKPVLSAYPAAYEPQQTTCPTDNCATTVLRCPSFMRDGMARLWSTPVTASAPVPSAYMAGGFAFARSALWEEVPYDEQIGFSGEELGYSLRAYSHGWDTYAPHRCVLHHYYVRRDAPRYSDDHPDWHLHEKRSKLRLHHLLGSGVDMAPEIVAGLDGRHGLGTRRSRRDFEQRAGINLAELVAAPGIADTAT